jgi:PAT family beta-lactamase induction signal transducer AmpG
MLGRFANRRTGLVLALGFSSGLPFLLTGDILQAWMHDLNFNVGTIGLFWLATLPYSLKLLWSPFMDRYVPPFLGRRRGWIIICQTALIMSIVTLAFSPSPFLFPRTLFFLVLLVTLASASQDIGVDAYRAEILRPSELGPGASLGVIGYQLGLLVCGSLALLLADHLPGDMSYKWRLSYLVMASLLLIGIVATLNAREPRLDERPPQTFRDAIVLPFIEFFSMKGAIEIFLFIFFYKLGVVLAIGLTTPFLLDLSFTKTDLAEINKGLGLVAMIVGTFLGGLLVTRLGILRSLLAFGILQGVAILMLAMLAHLGHHYQMFIAAILAMAFCGGMGTAAYVAFLMSLCDQRFTATQYAFFTSLLALSRTITKTPSGYLSEALGWANFFLVAALATLPGLLLLVLRYREWGLDGLEKETKAERHPKDSHLRR